MRSHYMSTPTAHADFWIATDTSGLSDLSTILSDPSSSFDVSNLSGDLSSILSDLTGLL